MIRAAASGDLREYVQGTMTDQARFFLGSLGFLSLIVLPVFLYLKRRGESDKRIVADIFALWILWYIPYAPVHEGCHFLFGWLTGLHLTSHQFIPPFWKGDFIHGYLSWDHGDTWKLLLSTQGPYSIDALIILLGLMTFRWRHRFTPFWGAFILAQTFLRSLYDVAINYFFDGFFGGVGDFHFLFRGYPRLAVHICAWLVMLLGAFCAVREILLAKPGEIMPGGKQKGQAVEPVPR